MVTFNHIPREETQLADALTTMSSMFKVNWDNEAPRITIEIFDKLVHCCGIDTDEVPWRTRISRGRFNQQQEIHAEVLIQVLPSNGILYKRNHDSTLLRCVDKKEAEEIMEDIHDGLFGTH